MFTTYSRCNSQGEKKDIHINKLGVESFVDRSILYGIPVFMWKQL